MSFEKTSRERVRKSLEHIITCSLSCKRLVSQQKDAGPQSQANLAWYLGLLPAHCATFAVFPCVSLYFGFLRFLKSEWYLLQGIIVINWWDNNVKLLALLNSQSTVRSSLNFPITRLQTCPHCRSPSPANKQLCSRDPRHKVSFSSSLPAVGGTLSTAPKKPQLDPWILWIWWEVSPIFTLTEHGTVTVLC